MSTIFDSIDATRSVTVRDGLSNLVSGLGTDKDKVYHGRFSHHWLDHQQLDAMYRCNWLAGTIVDAPADDMTREWRIWKGGKIQVAAMQRAERSLQVKKRVNKALKQARAFGGGAILIGTGDANPEEELDLDRLPKGGIKFLHNLSMHEIVSGPMIRDPMSPYFGEPEYYLLATPSENTSPQIHPSRVVRFQGLAPLEISREINAWGDSVLQRTYDAIRNAAAVEAGLAALVQEAKIDVIKVTNLTENAMDEAWNTRMLARFSLANRAKSINNMLILDKEEDYEQKKISLAEMPDVLAAVLEVACGAANIPGTRLLGKSPGGLGSNGAGELRHYYDTLSSGQESDLRPALDRLDRALKRHACGATPETLDYEFVPLWQLSDAEKAAVALQKAQAAQVWLATGLVPFLALAAGAQSQLVLDGLYPGLAEALENAPPVTEPPANDGSQVKNPAQSSKAVGDAGDLRTLYVNRPVLNAEEILAWASEQGFTSTLDPSELHVTVAFSKQAVDWDKVKPDLGGVHIEPGSRHRHVAPLGDKGAVVLKFVDKYLAQRWAYFVEHGAVWQYATYQPHVTLSYAPGDLDLSMIAAYPGPIELGPEVFAEVDNDWLAKVKPSA